MGKSEVVPMPIHKQDNFYAACQGAFKMPSPLQKLAENAIQEDEEEFEIPEDMQIFSNQVAGHVINGKNYGMIKHKGTILKPITNKKTYESEAEFYETIHSSSIQALVQAREFIPRYFGKVSLQLAGNSIDCIVMEDLTHYYKEPCVMDVKIGRRTWDPTASNEKIAKEETKYEDCKRDLGFCIPGFQVYSVESGELSKFDKEFGKTLNKSSVPQALKTFLNGEQAICRSLIVQFLACLWRIQQWVRQQRYFHFYSSSLLFAYDARRLRELVKAEINEEVLPLEEKPTKIKLQRSTSLYRPLSLAVLNNNNENERIPTGFSGQLTKEGPILKTSRKSVELDVVNKSATFNGQRNGGNSRNNTWQRSIRTLKRTHSFQNNYDKDMQSKKQDYTYILDELCAEKKTELWASVKMIDFAHVFPAERHELDRNYLEGIDNLIKILEDFLADSE